MRCSSPLVNGQATLELACALPVFLIAFFSLDFLGTLLVAQNRAEIHLRELLFSAYRASEGLADTPAVNPDPLHLEVSESSVGFDGRVWVEKEPATVSLQVRLKPHFSAQAHSLAGLETRTHTLTARILRDPWDEHPIKYATWGLALAEALLQGESESESSSTKPETEDSESDSSLEDLGLPSFNSFDLSSFAESLPEGSMP